MTRKQALRRNGPAPKPKVLQQLHGSPGHHPNAKDDALDLTPDGVDELWKPPEWFDDDQRAQWHYALEHAPYGLLTGTDREVLMTWCCAAVEFAKATQEVRKLGQLVKNKAGDTIRNPYLSIMHRAALLMLRTGAEMGFSPASRALIGRATFSGEASHAPRQIDNSLTDYLARKPDRLDG